MANARHATFAQVAAVLTVLMHRFPRLSTDLGELATGCAGVAHTDAHRISTEGVDNWQDIARCAMLITATCGD